MTIADARKLSDELYEAQRRMYRLREHMRHAQTALLDWEKRAALAREEGLDYPPFKQAPDIQALIRSCRGIAEEILPESPFGSERRMFDPHGRHPA